MQAMLDLQLAHLSDQVARLGSGCGHKLCEARMLVSNPEVLSLNDGLATSRDSSPDSLSLDLSDLVLTQD